MIRNPIAVVGIGCRLPGGIFSARDLWRALLEGRDAVGPVPEDRWSTSAYWAPGPPRAGFVRSQRGGFLGDVDKFDAEFFGFFPKEAANIDPQQRLLLEVAYECLADAGVPMEQIAGARVGVFAGSFMYDYLCAQTASTNRRGIGPYTGMGSAVTSIANRISYCFDLRGPSFTLDTACSSSLMAIHLACRSIWGGECDSALAGGVNLLLRPESTIALSQGGFLSPTGSCKVFDASADGYVRSEGVGLVYLKPLSAALRDRDDVYAVVLGSAANHGGYVADGFTVPSEDAQRALMRAAYTDAGVDPAAVSYVEAHGTGTPVGDPVETRAIGSVLGLARPETERCLVGSIKANLGHLEGAAGVAGFIKAALVAKHGQAPPNIRFEEPNPGIDFRGLRLEVPTRVVDLQASHVLTGVNAFGAGGSNAHIVLGRHAPAVGQSRRADESTRLRVFRCAARSPEALKAVAAGTADDVSAGQASLDDLAYSLLERQSRHTHQLVVAADDAPALAEKLRAFAAGKLPAGAHAIEGAFDRPPKVAFVYSGQGGQWAEMGAALMASEPAFAAPIREIDRCLRELGGPSVVEELGRPAANTRVDQTVVAQATIMAVQVALTSLFAEYGLVPDAVAGHSIGEVAAAWASGALQLRDASAVIYHRARIQALAAGHGRMLAVGLSRAEAEALVAPLVGRVSLAASNGPAMVALAGEAGLLESIAATLEAKGTFNRFVNVEVPYHSHYMEPLEDELRASLDPYRGAPTERPLFSTVTARREPGTHLDGGYWYANVRRPVLYAETVSAMIDAGCQLFIEIGPHPVLVAGTKGVLEQRGVFGLVLPSMHRREPARETLAKALGVCQAMGASISPARLSSPDARFVRPALYPWQRTRHWLESPEAAERRLRPFAHPFLESTLRLVTEDPLRSFRLAIHPASSPYLSDHRVDGMVVVPGTAHLDLALAAAAHAFPNVDVFLEDVRFESAIVVPDGDERLDARLEIRSQEGKYAISSRVESVAQEAAWNVHSTGTINAFHDAFESKAPDLTAVRARMTEADRIDVAQLYETVRASGLDYGPMFRAVTDCYHRGDEVLARLELPADLEAEADRHAFHPALFDACVHVIFAHTLARGDGERIYLPSRVDRVRVGARPTKVVWSHVRVSVYTEPRVLQDVSVFDDQGRTIAELQGFEALYLKGAQADRPKGHAYEWTPAPLGEGGSWFTNVPAQLVIVGLHGASAAELARRVSESEPPACVDLGGGPDDAPDPFDTDWRSLLAPLALDRRAEIVLFADRFVDHGPELVDAEPGAALEARMTRAAGRLISLAKTLVALEAVPAVTLVTRGAAHVEGETMDLAEASLHGVVRVLRNECPNIRFRVVDLDRALGDGDTIACVADELRHARLDLAELEVSHRRGVRFVRRLMAVSQQAPARLPGRGASYEAGIDEPGSLDSIAFRETVAPGLAADGVEIDILAAGLGFRDVQLALGLLASGATGAPVLGREVAGVVRRVGAGVSDLQPGDGVVALCLSGLSGRVVVSRHHVARKPAALSFPEAAALPIAAVTATCGLVHSARLERGDTVLVHSAAGGVGHAALRIAAAVGARVIATAGSAARREYLHGLGIEHVFDSRSVDFFDGVMRATAGRGADVVLNALQGRLFTQSLRCLAPHGRFVELGSGHRNGRLDVARLSDNRSLHVVDVEGLARTRPELFQRLFERALALYDGPEAAAALPVESRPVGEIIAALKHLTRGQHVGKVVLTTEGAEIAAAAPVAPLVRSDRTYLVTGGASGFGLHVARWLAESGARHLALVSRSGPKTDVDRALIAEIERRGARVVLRNVDVSDADAVDALVGSLHSEGPPLAGIVHSAGLLDDVRIEGMTRERFTGVVRPKAIGAWNLHRATLKQGIELEQFVLVSSISSVFGLYGQTNYAAANYALDTLAHHRRARGLVATSINFGVLGRYAGMSGADGAGTMLGLLEGQGWKIMGLLATLGFVREAFAERPTQRLAALVDFEKFGKAHAHSLRDVRLAHLYAESATSGRARGRRSSLRESLEGLPPEERVEATVEALRATLARILGMSPSALDVNEPLDRLALDSLMLTQLRNWILRELEVSVPIMKMMRGPSLRTLAADVLGGDGAHGTAEQKVESEASLPPELTPRGPWLVESGGIGAPVRMFCFHSMGVGASLFSRFLVEPPRGVHPVAVQTPGRENRASESAATNMPELAASIAATLALELDRPYFFWGHSFGGIVAFEVIRRLRALGLKPPGHLVVTGTIAPHLSRLWQRREAIKLVEIAENTPDYLLSLSRYVEDMDFLRAVFPRMRIDMPLLAGYRFRDDRPLEVPVTAFSARQDEIVYKDEILGWREHTQGKFDLLEVDGDHWFLNRNRAVLLERLEAIAASLVARPPAPWASGQNAEADRMVEQ